MSQCQLIFIKLAFKRLYSRICFFFFFQAEDGIRDKLVTGVQTCALPIFLSHGLWVTSFGRDPGILGRSISLDGRSFTVVGVMPAGFQFPNEDVQVWTPMGEFLSQNPQVETDRGVHFLNAVARLAPGVSMERVVGDVKLLAARLSASDSGRSEEHTSELQSLAYLVCRLLLEKKKKNRNMTTIKVHLHPYTSYRHDNEVR